MRKYIIIMIMILAVLLCGCSKPAVIEDNRPDDSFIEPVKNEYEYLLVEDNIVETDKSFVMKEKIPYLKYFTFIYRTDEYNSWYNENVIGPGEFKEGYLYSKELETSVCRQLLSVQIDYFVEEKNHAYFVYDNKIFVVDSLGEDIHLIYESSSNLNSELLVKKADSFYFVQEGDLCSFNHLENKEKMIIDSFDGEEFNVINSNEFIIVKDGNYSYINVETKEVKNNLTNEELMGYLNS